MSDQKIDRFLQENLLTLLAYDDKQGGIVARLLDPQWLEGEYRIIAERLIAFREKYDTAPGDHTADEFGDILNDKGNRKAKTYARILRMMSELSERINADYVVDKIKAQRRYFKMLETVMQAADAIQAKRHFAVEDFEKLIDDWRKERDEVQFDPGIRLIDHDRILDFLSTRSVEFKTGIETFDRVGIVPMRKAVMLFLAPPGRGKSWWLIHLGSRALMLRKKVLHISLEMGEEEIGARYYQMMFAMSKREGTYDVTRLDVRNNILRGWYQEEVTPQFSFDQETVRTELAEHISAMGRRFENVIIKRFAPRSLNMQQLRAYMDLLETQENFVPDLVILDYIGRVKTDEKNHRISLGIQYEEFRGIMVERNMAGATAHQVGRAGEGATKVMGSHVAEDWSLLMTSDIAITYSATRAEIDHGLARLHVEKARDEGDKFGVLITQNYTTGQFVLDSMRLTSSYEKMRPKGTQDEGDEEDEGDDADE